MRHRHWDGPPLEAWRPWTPAEAASRLAGVDVPWCVVGGWAIDLWLGRQTRQHDDLEVAIPRGHFAAVRRHLSDFRLHVVGGDAVRALADDALPPPDRHQNWVLDEAAQAWRMDIMLEPGDDGAWVFRRGERIRAPRARMVGVRDGVPYLRPEGVLLYKAKLQREKDQADFDACLWQLSPQRRDWLRSALQDVHPGHAWIATLADAAGAPAAR